jgi:hypothetical protein
MSVVSLAHSISSDASSVGGVGGRLPREVAIGSGPPNSERSGQLPHRFTGGGEPPQLLLPTRTQPRRLGDRQAACPSGFTGCGAPLSTQLKFQFGESSHNRRNRPSCRCGGIHPFSQGTQRDSTLAEIDDRSGDFRDRAESVDRSDNHGVAGPGVVEHRGQSGSGVLADPESLSVNIRLGSTPATPSAPSWDDVGGDGVQFAETARGTLVIGAT